MCDCFLKDSHTYLDHINGRKHQRSLGYSMRIERSTKDQVSSRLAMLAKEKEKKKTAILEDGAENFHDVVKAKDEEAQRRKEERMQQRKERKKMKKMMAQGVVDEEENAGDEPEGDADPNQESNEKDPVDELEEEAINPDIAAMMGFSGFR